MNNSRKILIGVIVVIAIFAAGWFFTSESQNLTGITQNKDLNLKSNNNEIVAKVNNKKITSKDLAKAKQTFGKRGQRMSDKQILEQLINQKLLSQKAQEKGYSLTTKEAESELKTRLQEQNKSLKDYKKQLESQGVSYKEQLPKLKKDLAIQNYLDSELKNGDTKITDKEAKSFYKQQKKRSPKKIPPYEKIKPQIKKTLKQKGQQKAMGSLVQKLRESADIEYSKKFDKKKNTSSQNGPLKIKQ